MTSLSFKKSLLRLKKILRTFLSVTVSSIICVQLAIYPSLGLATQTSSKAPQPIKQNKIEAQALNNQVSSLREKMFGDKNSKAHPLDIYRLFDQNLPHQEIKEVEESNRGFFKEASTKVSNFIKKPIAGFVTKQNLLFEVWNRQEGKDPESIQSVLSFGEASVNPAILPKDIQNLYAGHSHIRKGLQKQHFRISHQGKTLHNFHQEISWIASFGQYVLFLDPNLVTKNQTLISFINLDYFSTAIGETKLPIFHIPVQSNASHIKDLISPSQITQTEDEIHIGFFRISKDEIFIQSRFQELGYNVAVSLVDLESQNLKLADIKDIIHNYKEVLEQQKQYKVVGNSPEATASYKKLQDITQSYLALRNDLGSSAESTGSFAQKIGVKRKLRSDVESKNKEWFQKFSKILDQDVVFQAQIREGSQALDSKTKAKFQLLSFVSNISQPRPLGAPKIERALGLLAGTVLPGESIKNRVSFLKEAMAQLYSFRAPRYGTAALVGFATFSHPEVSHYFLQALGSLASWTGNFFEIFAVSGKASVAFLEDLNTVPDAYIRDGHYKFFLTGLASLIGATLSFVGISHVSINGYRLTQHLRSTEVKEHRRQVQKIKSSSSSKNNNEFISYMNQQKKSFYENLSSAETRKLGQPMDITLSNNKKVQIIFKNPESVVPLLEKFNSDTDISLEVEVSSKDIAIPIVMKFDSKYKFKDTTKDQIQISFNHSNKKGNRVFQFNPDESTAYRLSRIFNLEQGSLAKSKDEEISFTFSNDKDLSFKAPVQDIKLSVEDEKLLIEALAKIEEQSKQPGAIKKTWNKITGQKMEQISKQSESFQQEIQDSTKHSLDAQEVKTLGHAITHFFFGYSSLANTFQSLGLAWNYWFLTRNFIVRPRVAFSSIYFSNLFDRVYNQGHRATVLNGAYHSRLAEMSSKTLSFISSSHAKTRQARQAIENKVIEIEKVILPLSMKKAYFEVVTRFAAKNQKSGKALRENVLSGSQKLRKKERLTFEIYQRALFAEAVREFFRDKLNLDSVSTSDKKIKKLMQKVFNNPDLLKDLKTPNETEITEIMNRINEKQNLYETSYQTAHNSLDLFKKLSINYYLSIEKGLDPKRSVTMDRFHTAKKYLKDPEALARATRSIATSLVVDKPIELTYLFLIYAGVEQGILKVLHTEFANENALAYFGRYVIWYGVFSTFIIGFLGSTWMKVQVDSRLADQGGFEDIPTKIDTEKKLGYLKWYLKGFSSKDNTLWKNYKFNIYIAWANLGAALITLTTLQAFVLGRVDLDLIVSGYLLILVLPIFALGLKLENAFEKSVNFVLKPLIDNGIDFKEKHRHLLSHPLVQKMKINRAAKLRVKYNFMYALFYENYIGLWAGALESIDTSIGPRAFQRIFFNGFTPTEHLVGFLDWLEDKGLPSGVAESCKNVFTNNRTDLLKK